MCANVWMGVDNFQELVISFHHVNLREALSIEMLWAIIQIPFNENRKLLGKMDLNCNRLA